MSYHSDTQNISGDNKMLTESII